MIDLTNVKVNSPEIIFQGVDTYYLGGGLHQSLFQYSQERSLVLTVAETKPQIRTVTLLRKEDGIIRQKATFSLSFPYIQYYCFQDRGVGVLCFLTTFSPKPANEDTKLYEPPLPNFSPFMCITGQGVQLHHAMGGSYSDFNINKCIDFFWSSAFVLDRPGDSGWYYLKRLFMPPDTSGEGGYGQEPFSQHFQFFDIWAKKTIEDSNFILHEDFWKSCDSNSLILSQARSRKPNADVFK